jgi:hypothetical protein
MLVSLEVVRAEVEEQFRGLVAIVPGIEFEPYTPFILSPRFGSNNCQSEA